ncbi:MAG: hypothetical protein IIY21_00225 [Clostridiales bacterium]|nr:hypothetical protein [Clostridiales bacterium]MBQ1570968.1 hypothetical protein [Clostridiales bacterium]
MGMVEYDQIERVNGLLKKTDIKGKDYIEVNQRIKGFKMLYPEGFIHTQLVSMTDGICVMTAEVGYYENGEKRILGTGTAYEKESSSYINKTSYVENCETSAVGRALGMAGIGIDTSVASAEEVTNAINNQEQIKEAEKQEKIRKEKIQDVHVKALESKCENDGVAPGFICDLYKVKTFKDLTNEMFRNITDNWDKIMERSKG